MEEKLRYNELRKKIPALTERALSMQLKALEADGVVQREVLASKPPMKVNYSLTDFGKTLIPLIKAIANWGNEAVQLEETKLVAADFDVCEVKQG